MMQLMLIKSFVREKRMTKSININTYLIQYLILGTEYRVICIGYAFMQGYLTHFVSISNKMKLHSPTKFYAKHSDLKSRQ